jgi:tRNA dimethylallyltransferase
MGEIHDSLKQEPPPFNYVQIGLFHLKSYLKSKIEARTHQMLQDGLIEEVQDLLDRGLHNWSALSSVGYKETCDYLSGRLDRNSLEPEIVQSTMKLAKRQMTWFKRDPRIIWFDTLHDGVAPLIYLHDVTRSVRLDRGLTPPDTRI